MKRSIIVEDTDMGAGERKDSRKVIRVEASYRMGGMNYFSGQSSPRGYYVSVGPMEVADGMCSFMAFSGYAHCVEPANRFSDKKLKDFAANVMKSQAELIQQLKTKIIEKQS